MNEFEISIGGNDIIITLATEGCSEMAEVEITSRHDGEVWNAGEYGIETNCFWMLNGTEKSLPDRVHKRLVDYIDSIRS